MTTPFTYLPTRTTASLGVDKVDPGWAVDEEYQILLTQYNVAADWVMELARVTGAEGDEGIGDIGTHAGPGSGSLRGIMRRIGYGDPNLHRLLDHFYPTGNASNVDDRWNAAAAATFSCTGSGGRLQVPTALLAAEQLCDQDVIFHVEQAPVFEIRFWVTLDVAHPAVDIGFDNQQAGANRDGWGVEITANAADATLTGYSWLGAVQKTQVIATGVTGGAWHVLRCYVAYDTGAGEWWPWFVLDGAAPVAVATQGIQTSELVGRWVESFAAGSVSGNSYIDYFWTEADFSVDP